MTGPSSRNTRGAPARNISVLPEGYRLHWYELDSVLGRGGFGITYLAHDTNLDQQVAVKEFMPSDLAMRDTDHTIYPLSEGHEDTYAWGLSRFISEAQTLARFSHPNIVPVRSVFEANNSAYMVMDYVRGRSLSEVLRSPRYSMEPELRDLIFQLMDGVAYIHDQGYIHRDIKPDNVFLQEDGVPVLLDFGSARQTTGSRTRALTALVTPGYAPFEQYDTSTDSERQGPWTDIYSMAAMVYRGIVGSAPPDAMVRMTGILDGKDPFETCRSICQGRYSPEFLDAIDAALAFRPEERPQSVYEWRDLFGDLDELEAVTRLRPSSAGPPMPATNDGPSTGERSTGSGRTQRDTDTGRSTQRRGLPTGAAGRVRPGARGLETRRGSQRGLQVGQDGETRTGRTTRQLEQRPAPLPPAEEQATVFKPSGVPDAGVQPRKKRGGLIAGLLVVAVLIAGGGVAVFLGDPALILGKKSDPIGSVSTPVSASLPAQIDFVEIRMPDSLLRPQLDRLNGLSDSYQAVLRLAPDNAEARAGLSDVAAAYRELTELSRRSFGLNKALAVAREGLEKVPSDQGLLNLQADLTAALNAAPLDETDKAKVASMEDAARQHLESGRYVQPVGENAAELLREILAMDSANPFASEQLEAMAAYFAKASREAFAAGDAKRGAQLLEQGFLVSPSAPDLLELHQEVTARMNGGARTGATGAASSN